MSITVTTTVVATPILNDSVTAIVNVWDVGDGGNRTVASSAVVGTFKCAVEPQARGTRGEGAHEGYDGDLERYTNAVTYQVHFAWPDAPPDGLNPLDTLLWYDDSGAGHVLTVVGYWPVGNGTMLFVAKAIERT